MSGNTFLYPYIPLGNTEYGSVFPNQNKLGTTNKQILWFCHRVVPLIPHQLN